MLMLMMVRDGSKVAIMLSVNTVRRLVTVLDLAEVQPGFPGIRAS